ncbi:hypothetical protein FBU30_008761 [Linnemannia zychae]|nr:hypothetical protein FBU30_008761 [Linnemannia zychae]
MDPHSIKRPRIMPPEAKSLQIPTNLPLPQPPLPNLKSNLAARPGVTTAAIGLGTSSPVLPNFMSGSSNRSLLNPDNHSTNGGPTRRNSYSHRHSKDTLFHKDTHHSGLSKHQQIQLEKQKKLQQQTQLQQAYQEFHRQRELYQTQQQQQQQTAQQRSTSTVPSTAQSQVSFQLSRTPQAQHHHHHHHHHHFHVLPHTANTSNLHQQLNLTIPSSTYSNNSSTTLSQPSTSNITARSSNIASGSAMIASTGLHHHHHHHHHSGLHQHLPPQRPNQFSEWTNVKEKERARLLSNMARVRETHPPLPTAEAAKENLKRLSQRLHQRRTRTRETILYDLHQGVKSVEAQVHKQVDMVLSRIKDAPGSKYAFALTHTFLTQIPQALSNTILPSAISAVADTVAGRTTNSLTTLRGRAGLDEFDEDEEEDDDDEDLDELDDIEELSPQQQQALMRSYQHQDSGVSQQLSSEFGTIALASCKSATCSGSCSSGSSTSTEGPSFSTRPYSGDESQGDSCEKESKPAGHVAISKEGASEFLSASTHHNYTIAASQVLNAALPSFIPSMVAPIVCVFSYPSPPTTKPNTPNQSSPSPSILTMMKDSNNASSGLEPKSMNESTPTAMEPLLANIKQEPVDDDELQRAIKIEPGIVVVNSKTWTSAEREALFVAATRFRLHGQWSKIRQMMGLNRTEKEIEDEYQRLYGEEDEVMLSGDEDEGLVSVKKESDIEDDGDADDEAEPAIFMTFGGQHPFASSRQHSHSPAPQQPNNQLDLASGGSMLLDIQPLPSSTIANTSSTRPSHRNTHGHHSRTDRGGHTSHYRHHDRLFKSINEKPLRIIKKDVMVDKRFALEDIPMHI